MFYGYYIRHRHCRFCRRKTEQYRHHGVYRPKGLWRWLAYQPRRFLGFLNDPWRCRVCGRFSHW